MKITDNSKVRGLRVDGQAVKSSLHSSDARLDIVGLEAQRGASSDASGVFCSESVALATRAPRYTSYPTADRFVEAFEAVNYAQHLAMRDISHGVPLSVYLHIPFCAQLCFFCGCNKSITQNYETATFYVNHLIQELTLVDTNLGNGRKLSQLHWGGGTPTFLKIPEITRLMNALRDCFTFSESGEYSIEIDPRTVDKEKLHALRDLGFNRLSLGVQDLDEQVQQAINRVQSIDMLVEVLGTARDLGFTSTNFDLIYGLPKQSVESYRITLESVIDMRPERIALYCYAHQPTRFKAQRLINDADMPSAEETLAIFQLANELLDAAGYEYIGMDHFALPDDELASAHRTGRLHRNFHGYSTQPDCDLIALGASAISRVGSCYNQNLRDVNDYCDRVSQGILPTVRGIELSRDDVLRRALIMAILCQGEVNKDSIEIAHLVVFDQYFESELDALKPLENQGYLELSDQLITMTPIGRRKALRLIASIFDRYRQIDQSRSRFSGIL